MHLQKSVSLTTTELHCYAFCYGTWYIFTSAFLTISTHEFPLNFHPSRAAPRSCVATSRVVLEACSLPPRPEWFYIYACFCIEQRALWINHTVMILLFNISCTRDAPFLVTGLLLCQGGVVGEVVTGHLGARHRNTAAWPRPWPRQPAAAPLGILSATVTRQGRGSDQTIHLEPSCFYKRLLALFALLDFTLTPRNTDNMFVAPSAMRFCLFATSEEHHVHVDFRRILY